MLAPLELVPQDVLEHITFLAVASPDRVLKPPQELLNLLLTSSTLYYSLCSFAAPHLYARIFRSTFDVDKNGPLSSFDENRNTDSRLTAELVSRYRLLRRARHHEVVSEKMMNQDLCVALRMVIESNGVNENHLRSVSFSTFIFSYAQLCLNEHQYGFSRNIDLALWLLALTWSHDDVAGISDETRDSFLCLLGPSIITCLNYTSNIESVRNRDLIEAANRCEESGLICPSAASAAIVLNFILQEAGTHQGSSQLAPDLTAMEDAGLTIEDYYNMANHETPLFSDMSPPETRSSSNPWQTIRHDPQFFNPSLPESGAYSRFPDLITGLWEGVYMVSCPDISSKETQPLSDTAGFICKKSLQCSLALFFSFGARIEPECIGGAVDQWTVTPKDFWVERSLNSASDCLAVSGTKTCYEKFISSANSDCQLSRDYAQALDCLIIGQTTEEHDRAWGGFKFSGRLKRDGTIVMKREPKSSSDASLGTWIFEGNIRYGAAFVGTWRSGGSPSSGITGLFSLAKKSRPTAEA